jgi:uncharacterized UPF0146 family protein
VHGKELERSRYKHPDVTASRTREALVHRLAHYEALVEVGIGNRTGVAKALAHHASVTATDIREYPVPTGVEFVCDDITSPCSSVYAETDAIYALNCPPELQQSLWTVARRYDVDCLFTTLGSDPAVIGAEPETLPDETLFRVRPNLNLGPEGETI